MTARRCPNRVYKCWGYLVRVFVGKRGPLAPRSQTQHPWGCPGFARQPNFCSTTPALTATFEGPLAKGQGSDMNIFSPQLT